MLLLAAAIGWPLLASAYPDGAPADHTGGFGEPSCAACHFAEPDPQGGLTVDGLGATYQPGKTYVLHLRLQSPDARVAGFQMSARFAGEAAQAGSFRPTSGQQLAESEAVTYLGHQQSAHANDPEAGATWLITWTAPDKASQPVVFHAAAIAGNDDESPLGDSVYLLEKVVTVQP